MTPSLDVRLLGKLAVERHGRRLEFPPSRKCRALLAYLVATARPHSRSHLCDLLWETPRDPRASLRWALSQLRPLVDEEGEPRLVSHGDRLGFEPRGAEVDVRWLGRSLPEGPPAAGLAVLREAAARFRGEFLEGLELRECPRFELWCSGERERFRRLRAEILAGLAARLLGRQPEEAVRRGRERLALEPFREEAHADMVRLLLRAGDRRQGLEQYERSRRVLEEELGRSALPALEAARTEADRGAEPSPVGMEPSAPAATDTRGRREAAAVPPLVGRQAEMAELERLIRAAAAPEAVPALLVLGEAGIGKTRLLDELQGRVRAAGGTVLRGRFFEAETARPYGAWIDALRGLSRTRVPADLRPELALLLPELGPAPSTDPAGRSRLLEAVAELLARLAADSPPLALIMDDLHWADEASVTLLHYAVRRRASAGFLPAAAAREVELGRSPAARFSRALASESQLRRLRLEPLAEEAIRRLVEAVEPDTDMDRLVAESEGNPLFAIELARSRRAPADGLPPRLEGVIGARLEELGEDGRAVLPWAAALAPDLEPELLAAASGLPPASLVAGLQELEDAGILRASPDGDLEFAHDLIRRVPYDRASEGRRRFVHRRIALALCGPDGREPEGERAVAVAHHAALGGDDRLAVGACVAGGRHCLNVFAYAGAAELAERGLRALARSAEQGEQDRAARLEARIRLLGLYADPGMDGRRPPDLESKLVRAIAAAADARLHAAVNRGHYSLAWLHYQSGDFGRATDVVLRAAEAGREADPATVVRGLAETARCLGMMERRMDRAAAMASEAEALAGPDGRDRPAIDMAWGMIHHHRGDFELALSRLERAAEGSAAAREHWWEWFCLSRLAMVALDTGRPTEARAACVRAREVAERLGEGSAAPFTDALEGLAGMVLGEEGAGVEVGRATERLREVDSRWMLGWVQAAAAELDLEAGRVETARLRAGDALEAARVVDRAGTVVRALSVLSRLAAEADDAEATERHLSAAARHAEPATDLPARSRRSLELARQMSSGSNAASNARSHAYPAS